MSWTGTPTDRHNFAVPATTDNFLTSDFVSHVNALNDVIPLGFVSGAYASGTVNVTANTSAPGTTIMSLSVTIPDNTGFRLGVHVRTASVGANGGATVHSLSRTTGGVETFIDNWSVIGFVNLGSGQNYPGGGVSHFFFEPAALAAGTYTYKWYFRAAIVDSPAAGTNGTTATLTKQPSGTYNIQYQPYMAILEL